MKKIFFLFFSITLYSTICSSQSTKQYYLYLSSYNNAPEFTTTSNGLVYNGSNPKMTKFFNKYSIIGFYQAFPDIPDEKILNVYVLETNSVTLADDMLSTFASIFLKYDDITDFKVQSLAYPNDYGTTSPITNLGDPLNRKDLDYLNAPLAWELTTGNLSNNVIKIGISDTGVNENLPDFIGKTTYVTSNYSDTHGTSVAALAAAQGDNGQGTVGVCYDCSIIEGPSGIGSISNVALSNVYKMAKDGARVINMSWCSACYVNNPSNGFVQVEQDIINLIVDTFGTVFVAAAGNKTSYSSPASHHNDNTPFGLLYVYPASYENVITVASVNHKYGLLSSESYCCANSVGSFYLYNEDSISPNVDGTDPSNPVGVIYNGYPSSSTDPLGLVWMMTTNELVDIVAPGREMLSYGTYVTGGLTYGWGTSLAAPLVSGTIGLMLDLNDCLSNAEVRAVLQLTSKDIEHNLNSDLIQPSLLNQNFYGHIGTGKLEIGNSVVFVDEMSKSNGNATIQNHIFRRFSYELHNIQNDLTIENTRFVQSSIADFTAKNSIELLNGTLLEPDNGSYISLNIDSNISACVPSSSRFGQSEILKDELDINEDLHVISPSIVDNRTNVYNNQEKGNKTFYIKVFSIVGTEVISMQNINSYNVEIDMTILKSGMYIVKGFDSTNAVLFTKKIIKK